MTRPAAKAPTFWPHDVLSTENQQPLDPAIEELVQQDPWIDDFIDRLNHVMDGVARQKHQRPL
jgi:hypothetical protein